MSTDRTPPWAGRATDPGEDEADRLLAGDRDLARLAGDAALPLDDEVEAVIRRSREAARRPRPSAGWVVGLVAAAALVVLVGRLSLGSARPAEELEPAPAPVAVAPEAPAVPVATFRTSSPVEEERTAALTRLTQREGVVRYDVDPLPVGHRLLVEVRGVVVEVVGTTFDVGVDGEFVWVEVLHGRVRVRWDGRAEVLDPGRRFSTRPPAPRPVAQAARPPEPAPVAPIAPPTPSPQSRFAALLDRLDAGERTPALLADLRALAGAADAGPLAEEAGVAAVEVAAEVESPELALAAADAWLARRPAHPRRSRVLRLRAHVAADLLGDCTLAEPSWRELASVGTPAEQAAADAASNQCRFR